ncbi:MAG: secondary thiamine-phosphate synthase enzyme YjbQ [Desulfobacteraceae bacterium]|nr:secondary thiamine-phosphate synthase enzyme YjbQ [Desulfobacteraceae bacterium]
METIQIRTPAHSAAVDITDQVAARMRSAGVRDGVCLVYTPHTTAGLTINEGADPDVMADVLDALDRLVPWSGPYKHVEGNSAAHVKSILTGGSVQVIIDAGKLVLGTWERIFLLEFDGPRTRKVHLQFH